jgi:cytochrome P450
MVSKTLRWHTSPARMRRTALAYVDCHQGKRIRKVVMWYVSGNRDENEIEDADRYIIDQARPRIHMALGFGIHRCVCKESLPVMIPRRA